MNRIYFDWSGSKVHVIDDLANAGGLPKDENDEEAFKDIKTFSDLSELIDSLSEPTVLHGEATFDSYLLHKAEILAKLASRGHELRTIRPHHTMWTRKHKLGLEKSDEIDVYVIRHMVTNTPLHFKKATIFDTSSDYASRFEQAMEEIKVLRRARVERPHKLRKGAMVTVSAKDKLADDIIAELTPFKELPEENRAVHGDSYNKPLVAAIAVATKYSNSRREFESMCGLHTNGYGSQIRASIYHDRWGNLRKKGVLDKRAFRREVRRLYHEIKGFV